ncbi:host attachment protein [Oleiagrimonas sp. C23AA]|uniref:host attachment protein n=1 Tax=Oleiagrimonas sp. C23AA TaxID=2719047 RepID=UPI0014249E4E|nr:host attachment protein [Oleiagrimonas sp. C23AA]NII11096.1 host attachment protein [Oleiagrimonas sp. C23AA]
MLMHINMFCVRLRMLLSMANRGYQGWDASGAGRRRTSAAAIFNTQSRKRSMKTWVLVASRVRARLLEFDEQQRDITEIGDFLNPDGRIGQSSRGENRPPRTIDSTGAARHAIEPHTEPAVKLADRFAHQLVSVLEDGRVHHHFQHLVLIATPRFLGRLRQCMQPPLRAQLVHEINRDMTRDTIDVIQALISRPSADLD